MRRAKSNNLNSNLAGLNPWNWAVAEITFNYRLQLTVLDRYGYASRWKICREMTCYLDII